MFHYCTKLGANWVELVQLMDKFVLWNRIRKFSQRTHPIHPIGP